jgi:benzodiazapine receptor/tryptophan-rich sensory protein
MVATSTAFVATAEPVDRPAAVSGLPLALWTIFAAVLQEEVWRRNR